MMSDIRHQHTRGPHYSKKITPAKAQRSIAIRAHFTFDRHADVYDRLAGIFNFCAESVLITDFHRKYTPDMV
jgi:hypothetical protein